MRLIAPDGPVYQAGTLSGNPLAVAAGLATLRFLKRSPEVWEHLEVLGGIFDRGFAAMSARLRLPMRWNRVGSMGSLYFSEQPVTDWPSASGSDRERFNRLFHGLLAKGIYLPPSPFEAWFWSYAHTADDVRRTLGAIEDVLAADAAAPGEGGSRA
jgi:glutamate-1-semialdehyde 2,1-aminomutase